jgi:aspartate aminotransferase-like enzyme
VSDKGWKANERANLPRFYLDLLRERKSQEKGETAFTPAVSLVVGLRESLRMLKEETLAGVWNRHERLAKATRAASGGLGLELFSSSPVNSVTGLPDAERHRRLGGDQADADPLRHHDRGRQDHLKGKIVRIAHIGYMSEFDIITAISGLEDDAVRSGVRHSARAPVSRRHKRRSPRPGARESLEREEEPCPSRFAF